MTTPILTVRSYHPQTGALLNNISTLGFGRITKGTHSRVNVIDIAFSNVTSVGNLKLGLISDAGITANTEPEGIDSDGTATNGHFGIESSADFNATKASASLSRHFAGTNTDITADNVNNVSVGMRSATISNYIYLDIEAGSSNTTSGNGAYKIFFDFS